MKTVRMSASDRGSDPRCIAAFLARQLPYEAVLVAEPIDRCVVIELDPRTGERDADTLSRLGRKPQLGWGCRVIRPGIVRVGDGGNPEPTA